MLSYLKNTVISNETCKIERAFNVAVLVGCCGLTLWFVSIQFRNYGKDEDQSVITYIPVTFDDGSDETHPTYTFCLYDESKSGHILKQDSPIWIPNVTAPESYLDFLLTTSLINGDLK